MVTPPGIDLVAAVYGVWRAGGVTVVADRGLGLRALGAAIKGARATWVIGPRRALLAARTLRWAPRSTAIDIEEFARRHGTRRKFIAAARTVGGRCGGDPVHLRRHRAAEGGGVPPPAARGAARRARPYLRHHRRRPSRRRVRAVRAVRPGARHPDMPTGVRRHQAGRADGHDARRRLRPHRCHTRLRVPVGAGQRRGDDLHACHMGGPCRAAHRVLRRSAGAARNAPCRRRDSPRPRRCTRPTA